MLRPTGMHRLPKTFRVVALRGRRRLGLLLVTITVNPGTNVCLIGSDGSRSRQLEDEGAVPLSVTAVSPPNHCQR